VYIMPNRLRIGERNEIHGSKSTLDKRM